MAKPNYSYEKRQRELAKKRKKEEKANRKTSPSREPGAEGSDAPADGEAAESGVTDAAGAPPAEPAT